MGVFDLFRRKNAQPAKVIKRFFNAAKVTEANYSWTTAPTTIDQKLYADLRTLRARSREQAVNNDYDRRYLSMLRSNVIGHKGIRLSSLVTRPGPGGSQAPDMPARMAIERAWADWGRDCDHQGSMQWVDFCWAVLSSAAVDGEAFVVKHFVKGATKYELIDAELVDVTMRGDNITMGVQKDGMGRPVAYYLRGLSAVNQGYGYGMSVGDHTVVPASNMHHVFVKEYPGQTRGIPWGAAGLGISKQLDGYMEAAVIAARFGAAKIGFITTDDGEFDGDDTASDGDPVVDGGEPGWYRLNSGESVDIHDPAYPHDQFGEFVKTALRRRASGYNVSYNLLANDYEGVSFSALRHAVNEDQAHWKLTQEWFIRSFVDPVFREWLERAVSYGHITIGPTPLRVDRIDQYLAAAWTPRRWQYIDPLKDINAKIAEIDAGLETRSNAMREMGKDPDDVWRELRQEQDTLEGLGLAVGGGSVMEGSDDDGE